MVINDKIYFEADTLVEGNTTKIVYKGSLCETGSEDIYMHYGYGLLWENLQEIKLEKYEDCYKADICLTDIGDINFCFRDSNGNWDNNEGVNYTATISKVENTLTKVDTVAIEVPRLKKSYLIMKKIKISFYKAITFLSKAFTGTLKKDTGKAV